MTTSSRPRSESASTWWTMIDRAARGDERARTSFVSEYLVVVRRTLTARWRGSRLFQQVDDAVQDVFVDCLRDQGALGRVDRSRGDFGAFLHGIVANVALRYERSQGREGRRLRSLAEETPATAPSLASAFDGAWRRRVFELAVLRMREAAEDEEAQRRIELLAMRFGDSVPIRQIAARWGLEPAVVHTAYARARREFRRALHDVLREQGAEGAPSDPADLDARLRALLDS